MIVPDVNVLIRAYRPDANDHELHKSWLDPLAGGAAELGLVDLVLLGFLRIVTNRRVFDPPDPAGDALDFVADLRGRDRARMLNPTEATWTKMREFAATDSQVRANLVPDAWLAATVITYGARLATGDRGFARFPGLDWFDPAAQK